VNVFGENDARLEAMHRSLKQSGTGVPVCWGVKLFNKVEVGVPLCFAWGLARTVFWAEIEGEGREWKTRRGGDRETRRGKNGGNGDV